MSVDSHTSVSLPLSLLEKCQRVSYTVLEDMRRLYNHPLVQESEEGPVNKFLALINRMKIREGEEVEGFTPNDLLHEHLVIGPERGVARLRQAAESLLGKFERSGSGSDALPPPLWVRLLPVCCSLIEDSGLFDGPDSAVFRWMSFNVEVPDKERRYRLVQAINLNSNKNVEGVKLGWRTNSLSDLLFDLSKAIVPPDSPPLRHKERDQTELNIPYICWGIRFRSHPLAAGGGHGEEAINNWVDINLDLDNEAAHAELPKEVSVKDRVYPPGAPLPLERLTEKLFSRWAALSDDDPQTKPSEYIGNYCRVLSKFYPQGRWPARGVDSILSPAVFWSLDPSHRGTAALIFWGFEGTLNTRQCNFLLLMTQSLLSGIGQFARIADIRKTSRKYGLSSILHQLPKDIAALNTELRTFKKEFDEARRQHPDIKLPNFLMPDSFSVMVMFYKASSDELLYELPVDCAELLTRTIDIDSASEFVRRVVWIEARARAVASRRFKALTQSGQVAWKGVVDLERKFPKPRLVLTPPSIEIENPMGLYPLLLIALRNAYQHSYLGTLLGETHEQGVVEITHEVVRGQCEKLTITNTNGEPSNDEAAQGGWIKDLDIFRGLTGRWDIEDQSSNPKRGVFARYDPDRKRWVTIIKFERPEERS